MPLGLICIILKKILKKKLILSLRGSDVNSLSGNSFFNFIWRATCTNIDTTVAVCKYLYTKVRKIIGKKFNVIYILKGTVLNQFKNQKIIYVNQYLNDPKKNKIFLFLGRVVKGKGLEYCIKAFYIALKSVNNIKLIIVGSGNDVPRLKKLASQLNLRKNIIFVKQVKRKMVPRWMGTCDFFILPSLSEGIPLVLVEAMACGKPVIGTDVGGTSEIITTRTGFIVSPANAEKIAEKIIWLATNSVKAKHMSREARQRAFKVFPLEKEVNSYIKLYKKLINT